MTDPFRGHVLDTKCVLECGVCGETTEVITPAFAQTVYMACYACGCLVQSRADSTIFYGHPKLTVRVVGLMKHLLALDTLEEQRGLITEYLSLFEGIEDGIVAQEEGDHSQAEA